MYGNNKICTANTESVLDSQFSKYEGSDPLMTNGDSMSVLTLKRAYLKMLDVDKSIGWDEMIDEIGNTLAQIMGDAKYCEFAKSEKY